MTETPSEYSYWAFISYSSKDQTWAKRLHRAIETYGVPAQLVGRETPVENLPRNACSPSFAIAKNLPLPRTWVKELRTR